MQMSAEMAKHREDEISQDKTLQQQSFGRSAFRDKQTQLRIANQSLNESCEQIADELDQVVGLDTVANQSLDESCEQIADELDQVVGLDTIDNDDVESAADQTVECQDKRLTTAGHDPDNQNVEDLDLTDVRSSTQNKPKSVEQCADSVIADSQQFDSCTLETGERVLTAAESVEVNAECSQVDSYEDAIPALVQDVEVECKTVENLENVGDTSYTDEVPSDAAQFEAQPDLHDSVATGEPDLQPEMTLSAVEYVSKTDDEVLNVNIQFDDSHSDRQETTIVAEMAIDRQTPTDESSDAYTDVLDEEDIDRLSESLDKEDRPGPPVYVKLQNDLSALNDSPSTNFKLVGNGACEGMSDGILDTIAIDENEFGKLTRGLLRVVISTLGS